MSAHNATMALRPGFASPIGDAQRVFKAVMRALSRPGTIVPLAIDLQPPPPLTPEIAAVLLALGDHETPLWPEPEAMPSPAAVYLAFHAGVRTATSRDEAVFVLAPSIADVPDLDDLPQGTPEYPDRSATLLLPVARLLSHGLRLAGPGIDGTVSFGFEGMPAQFADAMVANHARYPQGIDIILTAPGAVAALPRSTRVTKEV